jgi:tetratricopeptide (TPR) repeat protein
LMQMAYDAMSPSETEDRAWLATQIAHLHFVSGDLSTAEKYASGALTLFPDYHYALGTLAQVRIAQKRYDEAVTLLRKRYAAAPHAENLYALAEGLELAGHMEESQAAFAEFERRSLAETNLSDNSNHELIAYYIDHTHQPAKALDVATRELARRKDVFTLDCYAWALAANGDYEAANAQIQNALQVGVKDPTILLHASLIAQHVNQAPSATR